MPFVESSRVQRAYKKYKHIINMNGAAMAARHGIFTRIFAYQIQLWFVAPTLSGVLTRNALVTGSPGTFLTKQLYANARL
jgi:hypothetical protein